MEETTPRSLFGHAVRGVTTLLAGCWFCPVHAQQTGALDDTQIVNALAPELAEVHVSTLDALTSAQRADLASAGSLGFRFEQDLNGDGVTDLLLLGQYQDRLVHGTFALVATRSGAEWRRVSLFTFPNEDFIVGWVDRSGASVAFCLSCDHGGPIKWKGSGYAFEWYDPGRKAQPP